MSAKNRDSRGRWRNKTVAFRVSPEEDELIETLVRLSGLTKQEYIVRRLQGKEIVVVGNPRVYKALKMEMAKVLEELQRIKGGEEVNHTLAEQKQELLNENIILKEEQEDFRRLKRVIGEEQSDYLIQSERSKEIESKNRDKVKRRVYDQYAR